MANTPRDRPGVTIHLNDNQSPDPQSLEFQHRGQERYSGLPDHQAGPDSGQTLKFVQGNINSVNSSVVSPALFAIGQPQKKGISPVPVNLNKVQSLKYVNDALCVDHLCSVTPVANVPNVAPNLPVGTRLQNYWTKWLDLGANPIVVQILREGYHLPFRIRPKLTRNPTVISCYVNPHRNSYLVEALHQLIAKNAIEIVQIVPKIFRLLQPTISSSKTKQKVETYTGSEQTQSLPQGGEIQNGNPGNHQDFPPTRGVGHLNRLQGRLLPYTHTPEVLKISQVSCPGSDLPVQSTTLWPLNSSYGVHCNSQGSKTDGYKQGYKNPPVPRRLVGESQLPPPLPSTYPKVGPDFSGAGLVSECRKIRTRTQTGLRICRLSIQPPVRTGPTYSGPVANPSGEDTDPTVTAGLSGPAIHVLDRPVNSHGKAGSSRSTAYEAHTLAPQKQLEGTRISGENYPITQITTPSLKVVAGGRQCATRSAITPLKTCSANFYRRIKRRLGHSFKRTHCKRPLVSAGKHRNYLELKAVFLALREFQDLCINNIVLVATDNTTVVAYINKEGGMRSGPLCALLWRILTWCTRKQATLKARHIPGRLNVVADKLSRLGQTIQTEWSLLPQVFEAICCRWHRPQIDLFATRFNNKLPLFVSPFPDPMASAVDALSLPWEDLDPYAFPPNSHIGQGSGEVAGLPVQQNHSDHPRVAKHALVLGPGSHVQSNPTEFAQTAQSVDSALQSDSSQESDKSKSPRLAPRASAIKEHGFSEAVAARIEAP